jgi:2-dehydropantoate 2-reductase
MWEKWVFLATLAGATGLMRASVGNILSAPGGTDFILRLLEESRRIAAAAGFPPRPPSLEHARNLLVASESPLKASMLRDMETGGPIEADHVVGDLLDRAGQACVSSQIALLPIVYTALKAYEAQRIRSAAGSTARN